ncbi:MAG: hypothetical protein K0S04_315 [Herbinix sp.]|jgi:hypothetical protein|nr:hypothetical protein [Herbinix sp.]
MKRTAAYPERRSNGELRLNNQKTYNQYEKKPSNVKPVYLEDHYGIKKEIGNAKGN